MAEVILKDIEKNYPNGFKAVHGINLHIKDGEFMVFVGPSGSSKSTTLRMIAGLEEVTDGQIYIGEKEVTGLKPKDRGVAMVFQSYALYPHMTVYENMAFGLKMQKVPKEEIDKRVRETAEKLEISDLLDRKPKEMSGGQRQRVAVGRAIVRKPDLFLFDEPLSNLDAKLRVSMRVRIKQLHQELKKEEQSSTMIYVTHDQIEAMTMGDRICVLNNGEIMQVDTPLYLYNFPANKFVASFIGTPAMNFIEGNLVENKGGMAVEIGEKTLLTLPENKAEQVKKYSGKKIWFGIRPENIVVKDQDDRSSINEIKSTISIIEHMGNEEYLHIQLEGKPFISRISSDKGSSLKEGMETRFIFDMSTCHIFDYESEKNIG